jgi:hypothetical protein
MQIRSVRQVSASQAETNADAVVVACGYEHRSQGITSLMTRLPEVKYALCFREFAQAVAREENEAYFEGRQFQLHDVSSNDPRLVQSIFDRLILSLNTDGPTIVVDISTMTRSWHGALISQLRMANYGKLITTIFAYVPSVFQKPPAQVVANEFVTPVEGFAALSSPEFPVAAIIGLGYEKEGALGLQQLLDPAKTVLFVPNGGDNDRYYTEVQKNNKEILARTLAENIFDYSIAEPSATFATLASLIGGLREAYRIVLTSLGPKIFGLISFLLATQFSDVSVWRVSSGIHGQPRDSQADLNRAVFLEVVWQPDARSGL